MTSLTPFVVLKEIRPQDGAQHFVDEQKNEHYWFHGANRALDAKPNDRGHLTYRFDHGIESFVFKKHRIAA